MTGINRDRQSCDNISDNELINRSLSGDKRSFEQLFHRYQKRIFNYAFRFLGDAGLAEETTQNTFLIVHRALRRYRAGKSAAPWIYRIAQNVARKFYHQLKKRRELKSLEENESLGITDYLQSKDAGPNEALRRKQLHEEMQKAINELPPKYRAVLLLHDVEGLTYEEIQEILGIPYFTAATHLARARKLFRMQIDPRRFDIHFFSLFEKFKAKRFKMMMNQIFKKMGCKPPEGDLALLVDGRLSSEKENFLKQWASETSSLRSEILIQEEAKIILLETPSLYPRSEFSEQLLAQIQETPIASASWSMSLELALQLTVQSALTAPRFALVLVIGILLSGTLGLFAFHIQSAQALRVVATQGNILNVNNAKLYSEGEVVQIGQTLKTAQNQTLTLQRPGLFALQLGGNTDATVANLSIGSILGRNEINLTKGILFFKSEKQLAHGAFAVITPRITIFNHGTIALVERNHDRIIVAVLEGSIAIHEARLNSQPRETVFVQSLQEYHFDEHSQTGTATPITQELLERLVRFAPDQKLVVLGLPQHHAAAALVDKTAISVAIASFNLQNPERQSLLEEASRLFERIDDRESLQHSRLILTKLANLYKNDGRLDISAPIHLFAASISSYMGDDVYALDMLAEIATNTRYSNEIRSLAYCAIGIIQERMGMRAEAKTSFATVLKKFPTSTFVSEARQHLDRLS